MGRSIIRHFVSVSENDGEKMSKKMYSCTASQNSLYDVLPYSLPVLHTGKNWYVDFYCFDPVKGALRRKKYCLNKIKKNTDRKARAAEIITSNDLKLVDVIMLLY